MVLAAGLATRLRPLSLELPKALMPLGDRPVLAHVLAALERAGVEGAVINTHYLPEKLAEFASSYAFIRHLTHEPVLRGTAGGIAGARSWLGEGPVIVSNADLVLEPPVTELLRRVRDGGMCMAVKRRAPGEGRVGLDAQGRVVRLRSERFGDEVSGADYLSVAALGASVLAALPEHGCLVADVALPLLRRGTVVDSVALDDAGFSMGDSVADYLDANQQWLARQRAGQSFVGEGASVDGAVSLEASLVGAGAKLGGRGRVQRSVVWPGARAHAPLVDAVVTTSGRVVQRAAAIEAG